MLIKKGLMLSFAVVVALFIGTEVQAQETEPPQQPGQPEQPGQPGQPGQPDQPGQQDMGQNQEQEINGTVTDASTGEPISGVEVKLERGTGETNQADPAGGAMNEDAETAETDSEGSFTLEATGNGAFTASIEHDGYEEWQETIRVTPDGLVGEDDQSIDELEIELQPSE